MNKKRCFGNKPDQKLYADYHDYEWAIPSYDDRYLFEMLALEGMQAGLNWELILKKRESYKKLFYNFDPIQVANMPDKEIEMLTNNPAIIRHRKKIYSIRNNATIFLKVQKEFGSFSDFLWAFVDHKPIINQWKKWEEVPCETSLSKHISLKLKKRGMTFVGPKIIYSYMQAVGLVNDHLLDCIVKDLK